MAPVLFPIAIIILIVIILIVLIQGESYDKTEFMQKAIECFEMNETDNLKNCTDFMNTGVWIPNGSISVDAEPLIRKTDIEIMEFVAWYKIAEWIYFGSSGSSFLSDAVNEINEISKAFLQRGTAWS